MKKSAKKDTKSLALIMKGAKPGEGATDFGFDCGIVGCGGG